MAKGETQRRVYVLPNELVERIVAFQMEKGLASEVEAARRLLDDALKSRDTYRTIIDRFLAKMQEIRIPADAAKDVLVGHPQVTSLKFENTAIEFTLADGHDVRINDDGSWRVADGYGNHVASSRKGEGPSFGPMDDEPPF